MGKIYVLTLSLLAFAGTLWAGTLPNYDPAAVSPSLQALQFGEAPTAEMVCLRGLCATNQHDGRPKNRIFSSYNKLLDLTHFGGAPISSPQYDYFEGQLFRVSFRLLCDAQEAEACLDRVEDELDHDYELTLTENFVQDLSPQRAVLHKRFRSADGMVISFSWERFRDKRQQPFVELYDLPLMESVRLSANPNYQPNSRW